MSITVNGVVISDRAINIESAHYEGGDIPERHEQAAIALTVRELLRQRAQALGLAGSEDDTAVDAAIDALIEDEVAIPEAGESDCREYYRKNQERFRDPPRVVARHILLAALPDDFERRDQQRATAEALIAECQNGMPFEALAHAHSDCPSRDQGGELGEIAPGATAPEFERALWRLPVGLASRPVETRYGWHVVEVIRREEGRLSPYGEVRERVAAYLNERARRRAFSQYIRVLAADAEIEGIELEAADSPLLQ